MSVVSHGGVKMVYLARPDPMDRTDERVCLVTGASAGIGLEVARGMARQGFTVVLTGRDPGRLDAAVRDIAGTTGNDRVSGLRADFAALDEVRGLAEAFGERHERLDVLIHNAGLWHPERRLSRDGYEETLAVNHLAPFLLTHLLLDLACASAPARVVHTSSRLHEKQTRLELDDLQRERGYRGLHVYSQTKLMNVLFSNELARRLEGRGVTSNALHPGDVATQIVRGNALLRVGIKLAAPFLMTPAQGARTSLHVATVPALEGVTGRYFKDRREARPARAALDEQLAAQLWDLSAEMVGLDRSSL
jgi:retinol dehydrogenase 12